MFRDREAKRIRFSYGTGRIRVSLFPTSYPQLSNRGLRQQSGFPAIGPEIYVGGQPVC
jgi:hypothetical protein